MVPAGMVLVGIVLGFGMATFEDTLPAKSPFWIAIGFVTLAGVAGYGYYRQLERAGIADERSKKISYKATAVSWFAVMVALSVVTLLLVLTNVDLPIVPVLWVIIIGSVVLQQVANEYYRRQM
jgi:uncharacterized membrane protein